MRHLNKSSIRIGADEPQSLPQAEKQHLDVCPSCQTNAAARSAEIAVTSALFASNEAPVDTTVGLQRHRSARESVVAPKPSWLESAGRRMTASPRRSLRSLVAIGAVVSLLLVFVATGGAENLIKIFEPTQVQAVSVNPAGLGGLPDLSAYGNLRVVTQPSVANVADAGEAAEKSGLHLLAIGKLPAGIGGEPLYRVISASSASFTFDVAKAAATAASQSKSLPTLPAKIDGSTLFLAAGPAVIETAGRLQFPAGPTADRGAEDGGRGALLNELPQLAIVQMKAPKLSSSGPSVKDYQDALLSMPGIPPDLAAEIRAIGDPGATLPIPIPMDRATSKPADIAGAKGLIIGDNTGIGSAVVWQAEGMVYAVGGAMSADQALAAARSMH